MEWQWWGWFLVIGIPIAGVVLGVLVGKAIVKMTEGPKL